MELGRPRQPQHWRKPKMQHSNERLKQSQTRSVNAWKPLHKPALRVSLVTNDGVLLWLALQRTERRKHNERNLVRRRNVNRRRG